MSPFRDRLADSIRRRDSLVCVGLDVDPKRVPEPLRGQTDWILQFNRGIIEATSDIACAYKPNLAFYEALGLDGLIALEATLKAMPSGTVVIGDAKRGDVGHTSGAYATALFERFGFDAITVNPYLGGDSVEPFLGNAERGVFLLCKTSNPGSGDFQDLQCVTPAGTMPLYQVVALKAVDWNSRGNVGLVVGATYPEQLRDVRQLAPDLPLLIPGVGAQAGDLERTILYGTDASGAGAVVNSSRQIIFASAGTDWQEAARRAAAALRESINNYRRSKEAALHGDGDLAG